MNPGATSYIYANTALGEALVLESADRRGDGGEKLVASIDSDRAYLFGADGGRLR